VREIWTHSDMVSAQNVHEIQLRNHADAVAVDVRVARIFIERGYETRRPSAASTAGQPGWLVQLMDGFRAGVLP
jgi:hypothetical protein